MHAILILASLLVLPAGADVFRHGRFEQSFTSSRNYTDPLAVQLTVEFKSQSGLEQTVPAFWAGGRTWTVRVSPEQSGRWSYRSTSSDPGMDGKSGDFQVRNYTGSNPLYRRGAPRVIPGNRYFTHADGTPWFWLACTGWNSALRSTDTEWKQYLADRAAKRFTAIQFVIHAPWRAGREDENGQVTFTVTDGLRINPAFFDRMDRKMDQLNDAGLAGVPVLLWALTSKDKESPGATLSDVDAARLAGYMVARYSAHHVLWLLAGDGNYAGPNAERWRKIGRAVFPQGQFRRPVSLHPGGRQNPWPDLKDEPWLDFLTFQTGHGSNQEKWKWNATAGTALGYNLLPPRPSIDAEINYEGHLSYHHKTEINADAVRLAAYYSLLNGTPAGLTYGAHGIWWWGRKPEAPLDHANTGIALPWQQYLNYPGAQHMKILRDIFDTFSWWTLQPDRTLLAAEPATPDYVSYPMPAWSPAEKFALLYLHGGAPAVLNLSRFGPNSKASWIDPRTGARSPAQFGSSANVEMRTPGQGDWLLFIQ
ncbi:MAG: DUF4038 domain-containing protein [Acidobacteriia bacterium]|nr:DUF4038 domain-containing protein [Terriglobia bacterium]